MIVQQISENAAFFKAMAPVLTANILTVTFVYCFAKISQLEQNREDGGKLTYLWLLIVVFTFILYGLYVWGIGPLSR